MLLDVDMAEAVSAALSYEKGRPKAPYPLSTHPAFHSSSLLRQVNKLAVPPSVPIHTGLGDRPACYTLEVPFAAGHELESLFPGIDAGHTKRIG
jgi:hypothetical protein